MSTAILRWRGRRRATPNRVAARCKASLTGLDRGGIRHLRPSLDSIGLFSRDLRDMAALNATLRGVHPAPVPKDVAGLRVGVCHTINWSAAQPETISALELAVCALH